MRELPPLASALRALSSSQLMTASRRDVLEAKTSKRRNEKGEGRREGERKRESTVFGECTLWTDLAPSRLLSHFHLRHRDI